MPSVYERIAFYNPPSVRHPKRKRWRPKGKQRANATLKDGIKHNPNRVYEYRKDLIQNATPAELRFQQILKTARLHEDYRFQQCLYGFILDFYFPRLLLCIEIDGSSHDNKQAYDQHRTDILASKGIQVIRFTNECAFKYDQFIIQTLKKWKKLRRKMVKKNPYANRGCKVLTSDHHSQDELKALIPQ